VGSDLPDDDVREARRARRRAQQEEKKRQQLARDRAQQALRNAKRARTANLSDTPGDGPAPIVIKVDRRAAQLTPEQAGEFDATDELVGGIVIALVPFDDDDPAPTGPGQKRRPCIVIGASASSLLVRPCYSEGGTQARRWQSQGLHDWAAAGLTRATFVENTVRVIPRIDAGEELGRVSDKDWNSLW
jgi:hypothetical protein